MFQLEQIESSHKKVKSGSDFPIYIKELKELGVLSYETFVIDGHNSFFGEGNYEVESQNKYSTLLISEISNADQFKNDLIDHQNGKTDYLTFCNDCAKSGIEKWIVNLNDMTCTYFDKSGKQILKENIPSI